MAGENVGLVAAFGGGMLSFLSPCVLPLVPGYLSLMSGVSVTELQESGGIATETQTRVLRSTLLFVAGFTTVFVALGLTASAVGVFLLDHRVVLNRIAGALIIAMGLFVAGFLPTQRLMTERRFHVLPSQLGVWAPPIMGMAFAFGWTPCIGPILGGVLTLASNEGSLGRGALLLAVYSMGLGVPFVLSGVALGRLSGVFGWVKRRFRVIELIAGGLLIAFGIVLVTNHLGWLSGTFSDLLEFLHLKRLTVI